MSGVARPLRPSQWDEARSGRRFPCAILSNGTAPRDQVRRTVRRIVAITTGLVNGIRPPSGGPEPAAWLRHDGPSGMTLEAAIRVEDARPNRILRTELPI